MTRYRYVHNVGMVHDANGVFIRYEDIPNEEATLKAVLESKEELLQKYSKACSDRDRALIALEMMFGSRRQIGSEAWLEGERLAAAELRVTLPDPSMGVGIGNISAIQRVMTEEN